MNARAYDQNIFLKHKRGPSAHQKVQTRAATAVCSRSAKRDWTLYEIGGGADKSSDLEEDPLQARKIGGDFLLGGVAEHLVLLVRPFDVLPEKREDAIFLNPANEIVELLAKSPPFQRVGLLASALQNLLDGKEDYLQVFSLAREGRPAEEILQGSEFGFNFSEELHFADFAPVDDEVADLLVDDEVAGLLVVAPENQPLPVLESNAGRENGDTPVGDSGVERARTLLNDVGVQERSFSWFFRICGWGTDAMKPCRLLPIPFLAKSKGRGNAQKHRSV